VKKSHLLFPFFFFFFFPRTTRSVPTGDASTGSLPWPARPQSPGPPKIASLRVRRCQGSGIGACIDEVTITYPPRRTRACRKAREYRISDDWCTDRQCLSRCNQAPKGLVTRASGHGYKLGPRQAVIEAVHQGARRGPGGETRAPETPGYDGGAYPESFASSGPGAASSSSEPGPCRYRHAEGLAQECPWALFWPRSPDGPRNTISCGNALKNPLDGQAFRREDPFLQSHEKQWPWDYAAWGRNSAAQILRYINADQMMMRR